MKKKKYINKTVICPVISIFLVINSVGLDLSYDGFETVGCAFLRLKKQLKIYLFKLLYGSFNAA